MKQLTLITSSIVIALIVNLLVSLSADARKSPPVNGFRPPATQPINHPFSVKQHRKNNQADTRKTVTRPATPASTPVTPRTKIR